MRIESVPVGQGVGRIVAAVLAIADSLRYLLLLLGLLRWRLLLRLCLRLPIGLLLALGLLRLLLLSLRLRLLLNLWLILLLLLWDLRRRLRLRVVVIVAATDQGESRRAHAGSPRRSQQRPSTQARPSHALPVVPFGHGAVLPSVNCATS